MPPSGATFGDQYERMNCSASPRRRPPTTAPMGDSSPPTVAAMKPATKMPSILVGKRPKLPDATMTAAMAPTPVESIQPMVSIRLTRTPSRRDTSGASAAARSWSPNFVNRKRAATASIMAIANTIW